MITGLFRTRSAAEQAYAAAVDLGYSGKDINVAMSDETRQQLFSAESEPQAQLEEQAEKKAVKGGKEAAELGGPVGGTVGTLAPAIAGLGVLLLLPGLGLVVGGPLAAALIAGGSVGVAGGLIGMLTEWGIPSERMQQYEAGIREGGILIGVKARTPEDTRYIEMRWAVLGGEHVHA